MCFRRTGAGRSTPVSVIRRLNKTSAFAEALVSYLPTPQSEDVHRIPTLRPFVEYPIVLCSPIHGCYAAACLKCSSLTIRSYTYRWIGVVKVMSTLKTPCSMATRGFDDVHASASGGREATLLTYKPQIYPRNPRPLNDSSASCSAPSSSADASSFLVG
jgi:hypothetical protein